MFCLKCGTEIPEGAGFCPKCGTATPSEKPAAANNVVSASASATTAAAKPKKKFRLWLVLLIVVGIFALLAIIATAGSGGSGGNIDYVKAIRSWNPYNSADVGTVLDKYMPNAEWTTRKISDAVTYIDVKGTAIGTENTDYSISKITFIFKITGKDEATRDVDSIIASGKTVSDTDKWFGAIFFMYDDGYDDLYYLPYTIDLL